MNNSRGGFWGLVEQKGPWKTTTNDIARSYQPYTSKEVGGGIQVGGTKNAGHAGWYAQMNPSVDPNYAPPPPKPSKYVQKSVIMKPIPMMKGARGSILYNSPIESMRPQLDSFYKPGHSTQPLFQESEVEAPRETPMPELLEGSESSEYHSMDVDEQSNVSDPFRDPSVSSLPTVTSFPTNTSDPFQDPSVQASSPETSDHFESWREAQQDLRSLLARALVEYRTNPESVIQETRQAIMDNPMYAEILDSESDSGSSFMEPIDENLYNEFQSFIRDLRYRGGPLDQTRRKTKLFQPFIGPDEVNDFAAFTKKRRNNRTQKKKPETKQIETSTEPAAASSSQTKKRPSMEELTEGVSLPNQIKELEKRIEAYKTIEKRKKLTNNQLKAWLAARSKLRELRKKRDEKKD